MNFVRLGLLTCPFIRTRSLGTFLGLLLVSTLATSCTRFWGGASSSHSKAGSRPLRIHLTGEPVSIDPTQAEDGLSLKILANLMDGLVGYDNSGELRLRLARGFRVLDGGLRYEFELRPEAKWSDGVDVQALDFVTGVRRALNASQGAKLAGLLQVLKSPATEGVFEKEGRVVFQLKRPIPYFLDLLTLPVTLPLREDILKSAGGKWPESAPVTGPYRLVKHQTDVRWEMERNPLALEPLTLTGGKIPDAERSRGVSGSESSARRSDDRAPERLEWWVLTDESTGANLFDSDQLDVLARIPNLDLPRLKAASKVRSDPMHATYYLAFNVRKAEVADVKVRRAISQSIHKAEVLRALGSGEPVAETFIPPGITAGGVGKPSSVVATPMEASKGKKGRAPLDASFDSGFRNSIVMEKVQADLRKHLGLELRLSQSDWKAHIRSLQTDPAPLFRFGWLAPFQDPISHLQVFTQGNPNNYTGWASPEYERWVAEVDRLPPGSPARLAAIQKAEEILLYKEVVVIPLFHYIQNHAVSSRVKGFRSNPMGITRYDEVGWAGK